MPVTFQPLVPYQFADVPYGGIPTAVAAPSGFPGITQNVNIYRFPNGGFGTNFDPTTYKNALGSATVGLGIYYVGPSGTSGGSGQPNSPLTIDAALAKLDVVEIRFLSGEYRRTSAATTIVDKNINLIALGPGVYWTGWNIDLPWSLTSGNIYETTRDKVQLVADGSAAVLDQFGQKAVYKYMGATLASITGPGQWATNAGATIVYVWPADNRVMTGTDTSIRLSINTAGTCLYTQGNSNIYAEGINFEGGGSAASGRATVQASSIASGNPTLTLVNCSMAYSADNGLGTTGSRLVNAVNCTAFKNTSDGFGYHKSVTYSSTPTVLEINCRAWQNGILNATSAGATTDNNNAFTYHDGVAGIRVMCMGDHSYGPIYADTDASTSSWNLGCWAQCSQGVTRGFGFHALTNATMYVDSCNSFANPMAQYRVEGSATMYNANSTAFEINPWDDNSGAGTFTNYTSGQVATQGGTTERRKPDSPLVEVSVQQAYTLNGSTRQITTTGGGLVVVSGSTASTTIYLPANPVINQTFKIVNAATVAWTLSGNGFNIDGAATVSMVAGIGRTVIWTGTEWRSPTLTLAQLLANANTYTGVTTLSGPTVFGIQLFPQSSLWAGTVSATSGGSFVLVTGSGAGGTLTLPSAPPTGWIVAITTANGALTYTLTAGGTTLIGTATTASMSANCSTLLQFNGTSYQQIGFGSVGISASNGTVQTNGTLSIQGTERRKTQSFASANTIVAGAGVYIEKTGAGAYTLALPTSPSVGDTFYFYDVQGDAGTSNLSVSSSDKTINGTAAGGGSVVILNKNNGSGMVRYASTGKWIATAF